MRKSKVGLTFLEIRRPRMALISSATNIVNDPITCSPHCPHADRELMLHNAHSFEACFQYVLFGRVRMDMRKALGNLPSVGVYALAVMRSIWSR